MKLTPHSYLAKQVCPFKETKATAGNIISNGTAQFD